MIKMSAIVTCWVLAWVLFGFLPQAARDAGLLASKYMWQIYVAVTNTDCAIVWLTLALLVEFRRWLGDELQALTLLGTTTMLAIITYLDCLFDDVEWRAPNSESTWTSRDTLLVALLLTSPVVLTGLVRSTLGYYASPVHFFWGPAREGVEFLMPCAGAFADDWESLCEDLRCLASKAATAVELDHVKVGTSAALMFFAPDNAQLSPDSRSLNAASAPRAKKGTLNKVLLARVSKKHRPSADRRVAVIAAMEASHLLDKRFGTQIASEVPAKQYVATAHEGQSEHGFRDEAVDNVDSALCLYAGEGSDEAGPPLVFRVPDDDDFPLVFPVSEDKEEEETGLEEEGPAPAGAPEERKAEPEATPLAESEGEAQALAGAVDEALFTKLMAALVPSWALVAAEEETEAKPEAAPLAGPEGDADAMAEAVDALLAELLAGLSVADDAASLAPEAVEEAESCTSLAESQGDDGIASEPMVSTVEDLPTEEADATSAVAEEPAVENTVAEIEEEDSLAPRHRAQSVDTSRSLKASDDEAQVGISRSLEALGNGAQVDSKMAEDEVIPQPSQASDSQSGVSVDASSGSQPTPGSPVREVYEPPTEVGTADKVAAREVDAPVAVSEAPAEEEARPMDIDVGQTTFALAASPVAVETTTTEDGAESMDTDGGIEGQPIPPQEQHLFAGLAQFSADFSDDVFDSDDSEENEDERLPLGSWDEDDDDSNDDNDDSPSGSGGRILAPSLEGDIQMVGGIAEQDPIVMGLADRLRSFVIFDDGDVDMANERQQQAQSPPQSPLGDWMMSWGDLELSANPDLPMEEETAAPLDVLDCLDLPMAGTDGPVPAEYFMEDWQEDPEAVIQRLAEWGAELEGHVLHDHPMEDGPAVPAPGPVADLVQGPMVSGDTNDGQAMSDDSWDHSEPPSPWVSWQGPDQGLFGLPSLSLDADMDRDGSESLQMSSPESVSDEEEEGEERKNYSEEAPASPDQFGEADMVISPGGSPTPASQPSLARFPSHWPTRPPSPLRHAVPIKPLAIKDRPIAKPKGRFAKPREALDLMRLALKMADEEAETDEEGEDGKPVAKGTGKQKAPSADVSSQQGGVPAEPQQPAPAEQQQLPDTILELDEFNLPVIPDPPRPTQPVPTPAKQDKGKGKAPPQSNSCGTLVVDDDDDESECEDDTPFRPMWAKKRAPGEEIGCSSTDPDGALPTPGESERENLVGYGPQAGAATGGSGSSGESAQSAAAQPGTGAVAEATEDNAVVPPSGMSPAPPPQPETEEPSARSPRQSQGTITPLGLTPAPQPQDPSTPAPAAAAAALMRQRQQLLQEAILEIERMQQQAVQELSTLKQRQQNRQKEQKQQEGADKPKDNDKSGQ